MRSNPSFKLVGMAIAALLAVCGCAGTEEKISSADLLKQEPPAGALAGGKVAYIDDGTCGPGKVKGVRGGAISDLGIRTTVWCAARPAD